MNETKPSLPADAAESFPLGSRKEPLSDKVEWYELGEYSIKHHLSLKWYGLDDVAVATLEPKKERLNHFLKIAELGSKSGVASYARLLAQMYGKSGFTVQWEESSMDSYDQSMYHRTQYCFNPYFDKAKAKEWERIAEHLEGKSATPIEREKFLNEFLYIQDKTPSGLYNIGYALCHNQKIGDKARGMDYLKHAANLGDANAARELGEKYGLDAEYARKSSFPDPFVKNILSTSYFWYKIAADLGHPNAKARVEHLEKAYPDFKQNNKIDEKDERNPSVAHIKQYPASAWYVDVPEVDVGSMIRNPQNGGVVERMTKAVAAIDANVAEFDNVTNVIQARLDDLAARQLVMDGKVEDLKGSEITALRYNDGLSEKQRISERAIKLSKDRWVKETISNLGSTLIFIKTGGMLGGIIPKVDGNQANRLVVTGLSRAAGYKAVSNNEADFQKAIIAELESRKIDTAKFPNEIAALTKAVQEVADSGPMQRLMKDENRSRAIVEGYLRQKILKSGLENARAFDEYAKIHGLESVDAALGEFEKGDAQLYGALTNLCHGHANSNDMAIILADTNALKGEALAPHEKALKGFVERVVKGNIAHYVTRASQIDVIDNLKLVNFQTMDVDPSKSTAELFHGIKEPNAEEMGRSQVDNATKLALTTMFASQFGVTHIGQYDVTRMFNFYLHRHGNHELVNSELHDGLVSDEQAPKKIHILEPKTIRSYVERTKLSASRKREDIPNLDDKDLFIRTCGYEYFLPQAVITSGRGNRFKENPEAPVAYPMVNQVVQTFIEKMSLTDIATYRSKVGEELDNIIAQTFIDFFNDVGREHVKKFAKEREYLRDAHVNDNYGIPFDTYQDKITHDVLAQFPKFLEIYERNLKKDIAVLPEAEAELLKQQISSLHDDAKKYLAPDVLNTDGFQAKEDARKLDHRGTNMTEHWNFG